MSENTLSRRQFLKSTAVAAGASMFTFCKPQVIKETAADQVALGQTGLRISRLGIGTGTHGGRVQRDLGQEGFNRLIRYAYDQGITYIDTADAYKTHTWIREAIKGLPRERLFILTKMSGRTEDPQKELDRFRQELDTDYIDCLLIHCMTRGDWDESRIRMMDAFAEAKQKGIIKSHGVSCHSIPALSKAAQIDWVDVNLVRINPQGVKIDTEKETVYDETTADNVPPVVEQMGIMREKGHGILGMKIIGEGDLIEAAEREKSIRFAMQPGLVDSMTIGFKSTAEIDEAVQNINIALAEKNRI